MKEYKLIETPQKDAEQLMNDMAQHGWEVVSVNFWSKWKVCLMITFAREKV